MNISSQPHLFWGRTSPLTALTGGALIIMASGRLAFALVTAGAILWVSNISVLLFQALGKRFFPQRGKRFVQTFLASFIAGLYLLVLWLLSPITALELFFIISLVPLFCVSCGIFQRIESLGISEAVSRAFAEAAVLGALIIIFAIIREPLGYFSLSLPGGSQGIITLFSFETETFLPIRIIASSGGALLLLGYNMGLYRYFKKINAPREDDQ